MTVAARSREVDRLVARCRTGLDLTALRRDVLGELRAVMPFDAVFLATVDPVTLLFTSVSAEAPLDAATPLFLANEYGHEDVNKFAALATSVDHAAIARPGNLRRPPGQRPLRRGDGAAAAG